MNLLANAMKFTPRNGSILIQVKQIAGKFLQVSVTDSGEGVASDQRDRLFKLFGQLNTSKKVQGIGLGLVISK